MMPSGGVATPSQRSQELRKYFAPSEGIHAASSGFNAYIQDDGVLTSFAETVAWRLGAKRVMISLIDGETQYFVAGAELDGIDMRGHVDWFGCSTINIRESLCQYTIAAEDSTSEFPCHMMDDLSQDERFCQLPVVNGSVAAYKFYAGTPIITSRGVKIGSLFLLDNDRRPEGLTLEQRKVMYQSSESVMKQLEMYREAAERRRVSLMSHGLRRFLEIKSRKEDKDDKDDKTTTDRERNIGGSSSSATLEVSSATGDQDPVKSTFENAASILRESLEIESGGVMFVDTLVSFSKAGYTDAYSDPSTSIGQSMDDVDSKDRSVVRHDQEFSPAVQSPSSMEPWNEQMRTSENGNAAVSIIAMSKSTEHQPAPPTTGLLDNKTFQTLLNMYPEGNVWYFDDGGYFSSLEQVEQHETHDKSNESSRRRFDVSKRLSEEKAEATLLKAKFDKARQIIFLPMWDAATKRWYAGCLVWSHSAVPVFTVDSEIAYLAAYTNSITVEISRLDAIRADQAKADFISSISHEFRSPLHGILASAEFLRELTVDENQSELISTIQNCGRTLLETIDHVLDFSKINSFEKARSHNTQGDLLPNELCSVTNLAVLCEEVVDGMIVAKNFDDVSSSKGPTARSFPAPHATKTTKQHVEVILDFEKQNWQFHTQPGALRRIIMNIFGNAQKYTDEGYIQIRLRLEDSVRALAKGAKGMCSEKSAVSLIIKDSGRGISNEYLKNRLYTPFAQDNTFASGVGLGLSIVWSLVQQMGGIVAVRSLQGQGTEVEICLPVEEPNRSHGTPNPADNVDRLLDAEDVIQALREVTTKTTIALHRPPKPRQDPFNGHDMILDRVKAYISDWYGLTVTTFTNWDNVPTADVVIALDTFEPSSPSALPRIGNHYIPMLLLNGSLTSIRRKQYPAGMAVGHVTRPVGPYKLAQHLLSMIQNATAVSLSSPLLSVSLAGIVDGSQRSSQVSKDLPSFSAPDQLAIKNPEGGLERALSSMEVRTDNATSFVESNIQPMSKDGLQILAVDDNEINLQLLKRFLSKRKQDIVNSARDGFEAVAAVQMATEPYDVVFMDLSMPGMDGFQATRKIRQYEKEKAANKKDNDSPGPGQGTRKNIRSYIVALTGLGASRDREEAAKCGFDDYLTKPIPFKKVDQLLNERSSRKTL